MDLNYSIEFTSFDELPYVTITAKESKALQGFLIFRLKQLKVVWLQHNVSKALALAA